MELELQWDGNPKIVLDIKTRVGISLPIEVPATSTLSSIFLLLPYPISIVFSFDCFYCFVCWKIN